MKLAAHDDGLMRGIQPNLKYYSKLKHDTPELREQHEQEIVYNRSYQFLNDRIKRVEFEWQEIGIDPTNSMNPGYPGRPELSDSLKAVRASSPPPARLAHGAPTT